MSCDENLFDTVVAQAMDMRLALTGPSAAIVGGLATAIDLILVSAGATALASDFLLSENPQLQPELELSHEEFIRTRTSVRTRALVDCIADFGDAGRGSRKPDEVIQIFNDEQTRIARNFNQLVQSPNTRTLVDSWGRSLSDLNNCIEEAVDDSMTESTPPCPRVSVIRQKEVCDRFEGQG